ncbi:CD109 antigen-like, partial [Gigantopelta aegis]|uniref:CD109 antigen-like n=1 Tax=Gigantopelta aegis TaxID=1735272 RepID=UPI001B8899D3
MIKLILFTTLAAVVVAKNSYVVLCPTTIRPGLDFEVNVNILKSTGIVNVTLELIKTWSNTAVASAVGNVPEGHPMGITLKIPANLKSEQYKLKATGSGGLTFTDETTVRFNSKSVSLFIQTDKAMYKPGQTVHFRTFGIYPNLRLYTGKMTIEIFDSKSNKIKQWTNVQPTGGVYTNYIEITDQPIMGDWKVKVIAG